MAAKENTQHNHQGNCFALEYKCNKCGIDNLCDVCHDHCMPRGECDICPECTVCNSENID